MRLESVAAKGDAPATVIFQSKIAHDDDGSKQSCSPDHGSTSQCSTSLKLRPVSEAECPKQIKDRPYCIPTDPDAIPFFVIPGFGPSGLDGKEFTHKTGVGLGDYGVVIYGNKVVAALVADEGPAYKIGEGSTLLLKKLTGSGHGTKDAGVVFVAFPGTADRVDDLRPATLPNLVSRKGCAYYAALVGKEAAESCL